MTLLKKSISILYFLFIAFFSIAQPIASIDIPVILNGNTLSNAWAGGLDLPQFSPADIDGDNDEDIIIFDRKGNKWLCFLNDGNANYEYTPQLEAAFPEVINKGIMRDYNCDGKVDIFAHANGGLKVYQNTSDNGELSFTLVSDLLEFESFSGAFINLFVLNEDIPAIEDIDGDGDMDILTFGDAIATTVSYYKNLSVESGYGCDSLIFDEHTTCWGNFKESSADNSVQLNYVCKGNAGGLGQTGAVNRHTGSTLCVFDPDSDNDFDLLLGDVTEGSMIFLENGGDNLNANITNQDATFPAYDTPIDLELFPTAYYLDVTGDGEKDLIVTPNESTSHVNKENVHLYENDGGTIENFSFVQNDFLVNTMIDYGNYSHPVLFDHNGDGLDDLLICNGYIYHNDASTEGSIFYYENTGSEEEPVFSFVTDNYQGIKNYSLEFIKPAFGDMDDDGDMDMLIGESNGGIHYFENTAGIGSEASFTLSQLNYFDIDIGSFSHPVIHDLNEDGLLDLVVGGGLLFGEVAYYRNFGTTTAPLFHEDTVNMTLGEIRVGQGFVNGYSAPFVHTTDTTDYLFVGSQWGNIYQYAINTDSLNNGHFELIDSTFLPTRAGLRTTIAIKDINNDNNLDYFVGNSRGGIHLYSDTATSDTVVINPPIPIHEQSLATFTLFPNPTTNTLNIEMDNNDDFMLSIFNVLGAEIFTHTFNTIKTNIDVTEFSKGMYYIEIKGTKKQYRTQKLIKN